MIRMPLDTNGANIVTVFKIVFTVVGAQSKASRLDKSVSHSSSEEDGSARGSETSISPSNNKFFNKRRYLFSKYDQGIKLDDESWYSVTPESIGEYFAEKWIKVFQTEEVNVLDAFAGCGGNIIQFAKHCNNVYGCEIDQTKIDYCHHNWSIYGVSNYKVLYKDYLESTASDYDGKLINAVFLSPPWGGVDYTYMDKYVFEHMHPNFNDILSKSLEFSRNLILYIPRNTDVTEICSILSIYANKLSEMGRANEVRFEIERLGHHKGATSILVIYTGKLANVRNTEVFEHLHKEHLNLPEKSNDANRTLKNLYALFEAHGSSLFIDDVFIKKEQTKISADELFYTLYNRLNEMQQEQFESIRSRCQYESVLETGEKMKFDCEDIEGQTQDSQMKLIK